MQQVFIIISTILALISPIIYSRSILKGKAKPHRTTRLVLLIITSLTTLSLFAQKDRVAIYLAAVSTLQSIVIFSLSIKYGMGGKSRIDILCLVFALAGIILWKVMGNPVVALYFALLADFTGMVPALIKTYKWPKTEIWQFFALDTFAGLFSLLAITKWDVEGFLYPIYIMLINLVMVMLVLRGKVD